LNKNPFNIFQVTLLVMCHGYSLNCFFVHLELWGFSVKEKSYVDLVIYVPRLLKLESNDLCRAI